MTVACVLAWTRADLFSEGVHPPEALPTGVIHDVIGLLKSEGVVISALD